MKILILGASGMLGHQMVKRLSRVYPGQVLGTIRKDKIYYERFESLDQNQLIDSIDVQNFDSLKFLLDELKPDWIINCVGLTLRRPDLSDMEKCIEINSMLPHRLRLWAEANGSKLIHFSTDCVFDGKAAPYFESDPPTAQDIYGKSKFLGEVSGPNALTLRLSIVGRELENKSELVEWFLSQKGKKIRGYSKAIYSGLTTLRVVDEVARIIKTYPQLSGIYHLASEPISKFELLHLLNEQFSAQVEIEKYDQYETDKTLSYKRYSDETGFIPPSWSEMIRELTQDKSADYEN